MEFTILGSGGCMIIPRPFCHCRVCDEAREKGIPYARGGPSAFLHDINLLIDTPAEISAQLNRTSIDRIDYLTFSHLDPDHTEGFRVVEQIALDFRTWRTYPEKQIRLVLPEILNDRLRNLQSQYGPLIDFYTRSGFVRLEPFGDTIEIEDIRITAIPIDRRSQIAFVNIFEKAGRKVVHAPCDIKPFPEHREEVQNADLLIIQPGIFEEAIKHDFKYPPDHISRTTLYTFEQTLALAQRIKARKTIFVHLEEYWGRSYDDYCALETQHPDIGFAYDGMQITV
ncbi:MAG: MBL fold metallo-hydrolase [Chloroflexota bacterium]|nr:MBL fold metallo-hydrolase [Chloroflexota bacterium]